MKRIWQNWRGQLVQKYIKPTAGDQKQAAENGPKNILKSDREWLVNEHFFKPEIMKIRTRNSENRANVTMLHRTGSTPFRHIIYDKMGGKDGVKPTVVEVFKKTRESKLGLLDEECARKHDEILDTQKNHPEFSSLQVVESSFGPQKCGQVTCFGYGLKPKDVRGPLPSRSELEESLRNKEKENTSLHIRVETMERNQAKFRGQIEVIANLLRASQPQLANTISAAFETDVDNVDSTNQDNE